MNNKIRRSVSNIRLSERAKERMLSECRAAEEKVEKRGFPKRRLVAVICAAVLTVGGTVGAFGAEKLWKMPGSKNKSHTENVSGDIVAVQDGKTVSADGKYIIRCSSVSGGGDKVFASLSLEKADGGEFLQLSENERVVSVNLTDTYVAGNGDTEYNLSSLPVESEYEDRLVFEAFTAIEEKLPEKTKLKAGTVNVTTVKTEKIKLSATLADVLSEVSRGVPEVTDSTDYYTDGGDTWLGSGDSYVLGAGDKKVKLCEDREIYIDSYCIAPFGDYYSEIGRQYNALYLSVIPDDSMKLGGCKLEVNRQGLCCFPAFTSDANGRINLIIWAYNENADGSKEHKDFTEADLDSICEFSVNKYETKQLCRFDTPISVKTDYKDVTLDKTFPTVTLHTAKGNVTLSRICMNNTTLDLHGKCSAKGELPDLEKMCNEAYAVLRDGTKVALGKKGSAGTMPDDDFVIEWLLETVIDPDELSEIHISDAVIKLQ